MKCCACKKTVYNAVPYAIAYSIPFQTTIGKFICRKCLFIRVSNEVISGGGFVEAQKIVAKLCVDNKLKYSEFVAQAMHRASRMCGVSVFSAHASQVRKFGSHTLLAKTLCKYLKSTFRLEEQAETKEKNRLQDYEVKLIAGHKVFYYTMLGRPVAKWSDGVKFYQKKMAVGDDGPYWCNKEPAIFGFDGWYTDINCIYGTMSQEFKDVFEDPYNAVAVNEVAVGVDDVDQEQLPPQKPNNEWLVYDEAKIEVGSATPTVNSLNNHVIWMTKKERLEAGIPEKLDDGHVYMAGVNISGGMVTKWYKNGVVYVYYKAPLGMGWLFAGKASPNWNILVTSSLILASYLKVREMSATCTFKDGNTFIFNFDKDGWLTW